MRRRSFATILVGPSALLREGLARILSAADFRVAASVARIDDLVSTALPAHRSILLVIDVGDDLDAAVGQLELFKQWHPTGRIAVLADRNERSDIVSAFRAGANAYFIKVAPCSAFIKSLELIMLGESILPAAMLSMICDPAEDAERRERNAIVCRAPETAGRLVETQNGNVPQLSARERCILGCLIDGDSNKAIARRINIAEATVKVHVKAILRKIRVHNRTQAAIWGMNNGLPIAATEDGSPASANPVVHLPVAPHVIRTLPVTRLIGSALLPAVTEPSNGARPDAIPNSDSVGRIGLHPRGH